MDRHTIQIHAPEFTRIAGLTERLDFFKLNAAANSLAAVADSMGEDLVDDPKGLEESGLVELIKDWLTLDGEDGLLSVRLLPAHERFADGMKTIESRFLVVEARHPVDSLDGDTSPDDRVRAFFLLVGREGTSVEAKSIFPYYVVSEFVTGAVSRRSHVVHARPYESPLLSSHAPGLVEDAGKIAVMSDEVLKAVDALASR